MKIWVKKYLCSLKLKVQTRSSWKKFRMKFNKWIRCESHFKTVIIRVTVETNHEVSKELYQQSILRTVWLLFNELWLMTLSHQTIFEILHKRTRLIKSWLSRNLDQIQLLIIIEVLSTIVLLLKNLQSEIF